MSAEPAAVAVQGPELVLYGRKECHLCEEMASALEPLSRELGFRVSWTDVDSDRALATRYGERVPVLSLAGREICEYFLDEAALRARLTEIR